jgi:23S rRNA pseudouridine1911/1915/1917 synthase
MTDLADEPLAIEFVVAAEDAGQRLDRFVAAQLPERSRSYVQQLIDSGLVLHNGQQPRAAVRLRAGDHIRISLPPPRPTALVPQDLPLTIVHEDADLIVVDKAAGMVVHPAPGHPDGTLVNALIARYPDMLVNGDLRPGIVHRLDRDTSGLLVVARNDRTLRALQAQQQARSMTKIYLAVVDGRMRETSGVIDAPIARHPTDRTRMAVVAEGRAARTHWRVLEELGDYTFLEVQLETGRTHQIRVHFAYRQRPVLADPLYGPRRPRAAFGLQRQFLHAHRLGFVHPGSGAPLMFESALPDDLQRALARLRTQR